jgi:hypothetical protein
MSEARATMRNTFATSIDGRLARLRDSRHEPPNPIKSI